MFLADFHIHSTFSDGHLSISELIDLYGQRGFGAIAITDHMCEQSSLFGRTARWLNKTLTQETFPEYLETLAIEAERAWKLYKMVVIPGIEITKNSLNNHRSAHVLALGVDQFIGADGDIKDIIVRIREQGALSIAAHPVSTRKLEPQTFHLWDRREELRELVDAWEVASGPHLFDEVIDSRLPMVANSDLHHPRQLSSWKTALSGPRNKESIFERIRHQKLEFVFYQDRLKQTLPLWSASSQVMRA